jgi:PAS domain S-box-containing protein
MQSVESQLKQSINDLMSKKEELQAVFDMAANGISILDHNGMFLYANKFFQDMMGYTMEELYSESCISLSSPEYSAASETAVQKAIKYGSIQNFRKVCITKSGKHLNASMSLSYLKSRDEIVMITSDITQDIKYQEELKKQVEIEVAKRTEQYEIMCHQSRLAAMGEMIDSIAHQWRQPLNALGLIVQGLRHMSENDKLNKEMLEEIEDEIMQKINYMSLTIDDFSSFFRISKKKESFDVLNSIEDAIRLIDVQLKSNFIKIKIMLENGISRNVVGFPNEFKQVIMNIVHNAMMAIINNNEKNGFINIELTSSEDKLNICISDNGGGIDESNFEKIFDPYFTTRENGSGIGLYMSKIIIEHHMQGFLSVQNHNNGTKFCIELKSQEVL